MSSRKDERCVVLVGNLSDGFHVVGPFEDFDDATEWARDPDTWIMTLESPEKKEED